jgi:hypothetical protein
LLGGPSCFASRRVAKGRLNEEEFAVRTDVVIVGMLTLLGTVVSTGACASHHSGSAADGTSGTEPCGDGDACPPGTGPNGTTQQPSSSGGPLSHDGVKDGTETDVDCGGSDAPPCGEGKGCKIDSDCEVACNYAGICVSAPSCKPHLGGDTCGLGEVDQGTPQHESCCRTLKVPGFSDPANPGKAVYVDKYEITAGRVRSWIEQLAAASGGQPNVLAWIQAHRPAIWVDDWDKFLPTDYEGPKLLIGRRLLGDVRPEDTGEPPPTTGFTPPPATDQNQRLGVNYQFGSEVYVDLHGSDCGTWSGSMAYPTYWYPPNVLAWDVEQPRVDGTDFAGKTVAAKDLLDVKSMNCITNEMLAAFCAWDGGQLVTDEVLDYITDTPPSLGSTSGCGTQYDNHDELLGNIFTHTVQTGGRCPSVILINATFDGGDTLPVPGSQLNVHNYHYPDLGNQTSDKAWEVGAPGRASLAPAANGAQTDMIAINPGDEPWMDLAGNLSEAAFDTTNGQFTGLFAMKYRGIAYGSARSYLNYTLMKGETIFRLQRPEAKAGYTGGRCMRFK